MILKKANELLLKQRIYFYNRRKEEAKTEEEDLFLFNGELQKEVLVPYHFYQDRIKDNLHVKVKRGSFKSKNMAKFAENIIILEKMLLEENKSIEYAAKWLGMSAKNLER